MNERSTKPKQIMKRRHASRWPDGVPLPKAGAWRGGEVWSEAEERLLRRYYQRYGSHYCARLLGRTQNAANVKAARLRIARPPGKTWTKAEDRRLRREIGKRSLRELAELFGRTVGSVAAHINGLGLGKPMAPLWTTREIAYLRKHARDMSRPELAEQLGRTTSSVRQRIQVLGLANPLPTAWTKGEDQRLRRETGRRSRTELATLFGRTSNALRKRQRELGLTEASAPPWSRTEIAFLRKHAGTMSHAEIAEHLGRTKTGVAVRVSKLGLQTKRPAFKPTADELAFISSNLGRISQAKIAEHLDVSVSTIHAIALDRGFRARPTSRPWTEQDDAEFRTLYGTMTRKEVAARMNRTFDAIVARAGALGLTRESNRVVTENRRWTAHEDSQLRSLAGTMTKAEIAKRLDRTVTAVISRMGRLGLVVPRTTEHGRRTSQKGT
jgi:hypothetical protein